MENIIIVAILAVIVGCACAYLIKAKKRGEKCIGCPYAKQCSGKCGGRCDNVKNDNKTDQE